MHQQERLVVLRTQAGGFPELPYRFLQLALLHVGAGIEVVGFVEVRIQPYRGLELAHGSVIIPAQGQGEAPRGVRLGDLGSEVKRLPARGFGALEIGAAAIPVHVQEGAAIGDAGEGERVVLVDVDGSFEHATRILDPGPAPLVKELPPAQVVLVGLDVFGRRLLDGPLFALAEHDSQRFDDVAGDLVLDLENVLELAVVALRPEVVAVGHANQLGGDPQPAARLAHAALENRGDLELPADLADVLALALEREGRGAGCDPERLDLGQGVDDVFRDTVAEILVLRVIAHIDERQHRDGLGGGRASLELGRCGSAAGPGKRLGELGRCRIAAGGRLGECLDDRRIEPFGHLRALLAQRLDRLGKQLRDDRLNRGPDEGCGPPDHLVKHRAQ